MKVSLTSASAAPPIMVAFGRSLAPIQSQNDPSTHSSSINRLTWFGLV